MNWLLPAQTLLHLIASTPTAAQTWAGTVQMRELRVSVISIAQARARIQLIPTHAVRSALDTDLDVVLGQIAADSGIAPLDFTRSHATMWTALSLDHSLKDVPQTDRQVYATAMYEGLTIAEPARRETPALTALGVRIHVL